MDLTNEQLDRYSRHILLKDVGVEGQQKLLEAKVLIIGVGGLGSPISYYLAAAGVGTIGLVDADIVSLSNLQRQIMHFTSNLNTPKVVSAQGKMVDVNPDVKVNTYQTMLTAENAKEMFADYDFIVDATDNFATKFLINDVCVEMGKPFSHGGILQFTGETFTYVPGSACLRCLYAEPDVSVVDGVFGAIAGMLGTIQAAEVLKYFTGVGNLLTNRLLTFDARTMQFHTLGFKPYKHCVCSPK